MKRPIHTISEYQQISADVWQIFKKYFPDDADTSSFTEEVGKLDKKYHDNPRMYDFMQRLLRVYFQELNELKELRDGKKVD